MTTKPKVDHAAARAAARTETFTVQSFCDTHGISLRMYYKLRAAGEAPEEMAVGSKVFISKEAAARWRAAREAERSRQRAAR